MAHRASLRNHHLFLGKIMSIPPCYWTPHSLIKWTSVKEANSTEWGCSVCAVAHSLPHCFTNCEINSWFSHHPGQGLGRGLLARRNGYCFRNGLQLSPHLFLGVASCPVTAFVRAHWCNVALGHMQLCAAWTHAAFVWDPLYYMGCLPCSLSRTGRFTLDSGRGKKMRRALGMLDVPFFKAGWSTNAANYLSPCVSLHVAQQGVPPPLYTTCP